ncbi:EF-hand calcium-binding domain-containing protein 1 isoform X1 [Drosophila grimshawi]|uniref:EF-hand calcium-binding domain-containing protein 1 isoform X1 n=1 Tax=Drosophila grimshawi TaxID=7222 RepID=UPI000C870144|nr:EF-hand calcium-binding domain-containing protein 1 isoform X1 [Drosophila grimshawi]
MKDLDATLGYMENARFNYMYGNEVAREHSSFTKTQLLCIAMIYHKFVLRNGPKAKFMTQLQLSNMIMDLFKVKDSDINRRIVLIVSHDPDCTDPKFLPNRHCTLASFIRMIGVYFTNDLEKRMRFAFSIYDELGFGYLSRQQMMRYVNKFFISNDEDEVFELRLDMLELLFRKFDTDKDLNITFVQYSKIVRKQPAMLEFLGNIFPSQAQLNCIALCFNLLP